MRVRSHEGRGWDAGAPGVSELVAQVGLWAAASSHRGRRRRRYGRRGRARPRRCRCLLCPADSSAFVWGLGLPAMGAIRRAAVADATTGRAWDRPCGWRASRCCLPRPSRSQSQSATAIAAPQGSSSTSSSSSGVSWQSSWFAMAQRGPLRAQGRGCHATVGHSCSPSSESRIGAGPVQIRRERPPSLALT